ncbi:MAG: GyrI-like domain-containing protein [Devosia sp.]|uniref:GyrI-like domain-containing protein n=1 Tax=Devosia sp. TaxID=1871048 RepID=UPI0024CD7CCD|nr:GyrI-like domain-containing protein [Devosia sp.]UYO00916.1 MAG: GyrI-like domain-containing protein [Devosia sp.]
MTKLDVRKSLKTLYAPANRDFELVTVPRLRFLMVDGAGDPNVSPDYVRAVEWLYTVSYGAKFAARAAGEGDFVVPPLEGLWWSKDPADFVARRKQNWQWTMMIMLPDRVGQSSLDLALAKAEGKRGATPPGFRVAELAEGLCLQALHVGSYDAEGPVLARLHDAIMPDMGLTFNGPHHEIYLSDPRRTAADRLKTILRQPVRPVAQ